MEDKEKEVKEKDGKLLEKRIEEKINEFIQNGKLNSMSVDQIYEKLKKEFSEECKKHKFDCSRKWFDDKLNELVWTEKVITMLRETITNNLSLKKFVEYFPYIPFKMIQVKAKKLKGTTTVNYQKSSSAHGIGRIGDLANIEIEKYTIPDTSFHAPFVITTQDAKNGKWYIRVINGPNVGVLYPPIMQENVVRSAFAGARYGKCDAIILTNLFDIDTKKAAGPAKVLRSLFSGRNIKTDIFPESYREEAKRILGELPNDEVVYEQFEEAFENIMGGWFKITHLPDGKPEYDGNVYIILGRKEEDIVLTATYWEVQRHTVVKRNKLKVEMELALSAFASALGDKKQNKKKIEACKQKVKELQDEEGRTRITNVPPDEWLRFYKKVLAFVIKRIKETIPNAVVIGKGTTFATVANEIVKFHIPESVDVSDNILANYVQNYGPETLRKEIPQIVIICHPHSLNFRETGREADTDGERKNTIQICAAPVCMDGDFLRKRLNVVKKKGHPIGKLVFNEQFAPGVLDIRCIDGIVVPDMVPVSALLPHEINIIKNKGETKYIYIMVNTDKHWGGRPKVFVWNRIQQKKLDMGGATFELMRRAGYGEQKLPPVHIYTSNDDIVQGHHFAGEKQPDPGQMSYVMIEDAWNDALHRAQNAKEKEDILKIIADLQTFNLYQFQVRGTDWITDQLEEALQRDIEPNADMLNAILMRAVETKLKFRGVSFYRNLLYDKRDIGVINFGSGNHFGKSVDNHLVENIIYRNYLRLICKNHPYWKDKQKILPTLITAPLFGNLSIGWGTVQAPDGYIWGFDIRSTVVPPKKLNWNDPLMTNVRTDLSRGNYTRFFEDKKVVKIYGDKHYFSAVDTSHALYVMGPAGTETDSFGELGFSPNNTGVVFIGIPAKGPNSGPILIRPLLYYHIKRLIEQSTSFDWESFLPNPV